MYDELPPLVDSHVQKGVAETRVGYAHRKDGTHGCIQYHKSAGSALAVRRYLEACDILGIAFETWMGGAECDKRTLVQLYVLMCMVRVGKFSSEREIKACGMSPAKHPYIQALHVRVPLSDNIYSMGVRVESLNTLRRIMKKFGAEIEYENVQAMKRILRSLGELSLTRDTSQRAKPIDIGRQWEFGFWDKLGIWDLEYGVVGLGNRKFGIWDSESGIRVVVKDWVMIFRIGRHEVNLVLFVASYGHPAEHGVMNTGVYLPRGMHCRVQGDMHINMHANIRTNVITSIITFMGMGKVCCGVTLVSIDREA